MRLGPAATPSSDSGSTVLISRRGPAPVQSGAPPPDVTGAWQGGVGLSRDRAAVKAVGELAVMAGGRCGHAEALMVAV